MGYYDIEDYKAYEKKQSDIDNEIKRLKDKIKKIKSDNSKEKRQARNHLMILIGAEVLKWTDFDFETEDFNLQGWRAYCNKYSKNIPEWCITTKPSEQSQEESQESTSVQELEEEQQPAPEEEYQEENRDQYQANIDNYTSEDKEIF